MKQLLAISIVFIVFSPYVIIRTVCYPFYRFAKYYVWFFENVIDYPTKWTRLFYIKLRNMEFGDKQ